MAYDRPSPKLIAFLRKHYKLTDYIPQNNNYVIFDSYFGREGQNKEYDEKGSWKRSTLRRQSNNGCTFKTENNSDNRMFDGNVFGIF